MSSRSSQGSIFRKNGPYKVTNATTHTTAEKQMGIKQIGIKILGSRDFFINKQSRLFGHLDCTIISKMIHTR